MGTICTSWECKSTHCPNLDLTTTAEPAYGSLFVGERAIHLLLNQSIWRLKSSRASGTQLLGLLDQLKKTIETLSDWKLPLEQSEHYQLTATAQRFEHVLAAELGSYLCPQFRLTTRPRAA